MVRRDREHPPRNAGPPPSSSIIHQMLLCVGFSKYPQVAVETATSLVFTWLHRDWILAETCLFGHSFCPADICDVAFITNFVPDVSMMHFYIWRIKTWSVTTEAFQNFENQRFLWSQKEMKSEDEGEKEGGLKRRDGGKADSVFFERCKTPGLCDGAAASATAANTRRPDARRRCRKREHFHCLLR